MLHYSVWNIDNIQTLNIFVDEMHHTTVFALLVLLEGATNCVPVR